MVYGLWSSGCACVPLGASYLGPQPLPAELAAYYAYPKRTTQHVVQLIEKRPRFRESLVRFPFSAPDFEPTESIVEFEWFESSQSGRRPAILFNPILGGDYPLERDMCRYFAAHGFYVALIHRKTIKISPEQPIDHLELLLRQGIMRIRQVVDWMQTNERVDPSRMGSFGISMGGVASVMVAALEPRLRAHVIALAGGSIPDILVSSHDKLLTRPRTKYMKTHHMDLKTLEARLRETIKTDPMRLAAFVDSRRLRVFIALFDRTIGTANALRLWRALRRPCATFLPFGHYTAYLLLPYLEHESLRFFRAAL